MAINPKLYKGVMRKLKSYIGKEAKYLPRIAITEKDQKFHIDALVIITEEPIGSKIRMVKVRGVYHPFEETNVFLDDLKIVGDTNRREAQMYRSRD